MGAIPSTWVVSVSSKMKIPEHRTIIPSSCTAKEVANKTFVVGLYLLAHCEFSALEDCKEAEQESECRFLDLKSSELDFKL
jgi:hypothetical protein